MQNYYKKQVEIAREFGVSEGTVTNWIKGSEEGKNNLQIVEIEGKKKIVKNEHNRVEMLNLKDVGRKYRPDDEYLEIDVSEELYEIMSPNQILSLINSVQTKNEIPMKFSFLGKGAAIWEDFHRRATKDPGYTNFDETLLDNFYKYILNLLKEGSKVNVVDIGPGNIDPLMLFVKKLHRDGLLNKYIAIDVSKDMIDCAEKNIKHNLPEIVFESFTTDIEIESVQNILYSSKLSKDTDNIVNLVFLLGGTIGNMGAIHQQIRVLSNIGDGLYPNDLLFISNAFDANFNKNVFPKFEIQNGDEQELYIPKLMNLDLHLFNKEAIYNEKTDIREYNLIFNQNVKINFTHNQASIFLNKHDRLNIWKSKKDTFESISKKVFEANMQLQFIAKHPVNEVIMYIVKKARS